jgi:hypothetical protein
MSRTYVATFVCDDDIRFDVQFESTGKTLEELRRDAGEALKVQRKCEQTLLAAIMQMASIKIRPK